MMLPLTQTGEGEQQAETGAFLGQGISNCINVDFVDTCIAV